MGAIKTGVRTGGAKVWMLLPLTVSTAEIVDASPAFKSPAFSGATTTSTDGTVLNDVVVNNLTTGTDPGTFNFELVPDPSVVANMTAITKLLGAKGQSARVFIAAADGTQAAPTLPTNVGGVLGWTLPTTPTAFTYYEFEIELPTAYSEVIEQQSIVRYSAQATKKSATSVAHKGAAAVVTLQG
jgi:hypothetical protein